MSLPSSGLRGLRQLQNDQQDCSNNKRKVCSQRQFQKLGKVFAVKRERPSVKRSDTSCLRAQRVAEGESCLWPLGGILGEGSHHDLGHALGYLLTVRAQGRRRQFQMLPNDIPRVTGEWRLAASIW